MIEIKLREIIEHDFDDFYKLISDPKIKNAGVPKNLDQEKGRNIFSTVVNNKWYKKICLAESEKLIGVIFLNSRGESKDLVNTKEIGFAINSNYQNQGIATKAVGLASEYAKNNNIKELWASTLFENIASQKVLMRNDFEYKYDADMSIFNLPDQKYYLKHLEK